MVMGCSRRNVNIDSEGTITDLPRVKTCVPAPAPAPAAAPIAAPLPPPASAPTIAPSEAPPPTKAAVRLFFPTLSRRELLNWLASAVTAYR